MARPGWTGLDILRIGPVPKLAIASSSTASLALMLVLACSFVNLSVLLAGASTTAIPFRVPTSSVPEFLGLGRRYEK